MECRVSFGLFGIRDYDGTDSGRVDEGDLVQVEVDVAVAAEVEFIGGVGDAGTGGDVEFSRPCRRDPRLRYDVELVIKGGEGKHPCHPVPGTSNT